MKHRNLIAGSAIASVLAIGVLGVTTETAVAAKSKPVEKCYGIAKAGKNDCQTAKSACAGTSTADAQKDAWLYVPKGSCEKIVNGNLAAA